MAVVIRKWFVAGVVGGAVGTLVFTTLHRFVIADIWGFFGPMLVVGILCGAAIATAYGVVAAHPSNRSWFGYTGLFYLLLGLLGLVSILIFDPVTELTSLLSTGGVPPRELIRHTFGLIIIFAVVSALILGLIFGDKKWHPLAMFPATLLVMFAFGSNIAAFGLVELSGPAVQAMGKVLLIALALVASYAATVSLMLRPSRDSVTEPSASAGVGH